MFSSQMKSFRYTTHIILLWCALAFSAAQAAEPLPDGITEFQVYGATVFDKKELARMVAPFVGKARRSVDIGKAISAIEAAYADQGYAAVQIITPEQDYANGRVILRIVEGRMQYVVVRGQKYFTEESIYYTLPSLRQGSLVRPAQIEKEVRFANENPARHIEAQLRNGTGDNQLNADVKVTDRDPNTFGITLDNAGTLETGLARLGLFYRNANVQNTDRVLTLQTLIFPRYSRNIKVAGLGYKIPFYDMCDSIEFFGGYSEINAVDGGLPNFQAGGKLLNVRYNQGLETPGFIEHRFIYGFDWHYFRRLEQSDGSPLYNDIVVTPLSLFYVAQGETRHSTTEFKIGLIANLGFMGKGQHDDFAWYDPSAAINPDMNYRILRVDTSHLQTLDNDLQIRLAIAGQLSRNVLVLGERMRLGGMDGVRGFLEGSESGDSGARGTLELYSPEYKDETSSKRGLMFVDGGAVRSQDGSHSTIMSTGVGLRKKWQPVELRLDVARILKSGVDTQKALAGWYLHVALSSYF